VQFQVLGYPTHLLTLHPRLSPLPVPDPTPEGPAIAILIDDLGNNPSALGGLWELETPFSVAILPFTPYALPLAGVRQMRPDSALLRDLASDADPWGPVEVHCVWTPFDLMILPPRSSELTRVASATRIPVKMHRWMLSDPRVLDHVAALLLRP
jgi:hypothetical protein